MKKVFPDKIGVEVEGAWDNIVPILPFLKRDSSVSVRGYDNEGYSYAESWNGMTDKAKEEVIQAHKDRSRSGEIASPILSSTGEVKEFLSTFYPSKTNSTCGLHVHVSFNKLFPYAGLMTRGFYEYLMIAINHFGDKYANTGTEEDANYWDRFQGKNDYCLKRYSPLLNTEGYQTPQKYRLMNYYSYVCRNTFECRAFPAFSKSDIAILAVETFLMTINDYLRNMVDKNTPEVKANYAVLKRYARPESPLFHEVIE